jgi:hypothetical protein
VFIKFGTVFKIELVLATFLGWTSGNVTLRRRIVQDGCSELLID